MSDWRSEPPDSASATTCLHWWSYVCQTTDGRDVLGCNYCGAIHVAKYWTDSNTNGQPLPEPPGD